MKNTNIWQYHMRSRMYLSNSSIRYVRWKMSGSEKYARPNVDGLDLARANEAESHIIEDCRQSHTHSSLPSDIKPAHRSRRSLFTLELVAGSHSPSPSRFRAFKALVTSHTSFRKRSMSLPQANHYPLSINQPKTQANTRWTYRDQLLYNLATLPEHSWGRTINSYSRCISTIRRYLATKRDISWTHEPSIPLS